MAGNVTLGAITILTPAQGTWVLVKPGIMQPRRIKEEIPGQFDGAYLKEMGIGTGETVIRFRWKLANAETARAIIRSIRDLGAATLSLPGRYSEPYMAVDDDGINIISERPCFLTMNPATYGFETIADIVFTQVGEN
jgi:hypothetical protein